MTATATADLPLTADLSGSPLVGTVTGESCRAIAAEARSGAEGTSQKHRTQAAGGAKGVSRQGGGDKSAQPKAKQGGDARENRQSRAGADQAVEAAGQDGQAQPAQHRKQHQRHKHGSGRQQLESQMERLLQSMAEKVDWITLVRKELQKITPMQKLPELVQQSTFLQRKIRDDLLADSGRFESMLRRARQTLAPEAVAALEERHRTAKNDFFKKGYHRVTALLKQKEAVLAEHAKAEVREAPLSNRLEKLWSGQDGVLARAAEITEHWQAAQENGREQPGLLYQLKRRVAHFEKAAREFELKLETFKAGKQEAAVVGRCERELKDIRRGLEKMLAQARGGK